MNRCIKCGTFAHEHGPSCSCLFDPFYTTGLPAFLMISAAEVEQDAETFVRTHIPTS